MYIEESFDTIFNMDYGSSKSAMDERVKEQTVMKTFYEQGWKRDTRPGLNQAVGNL